MKFKKIQLNYFKKKLLKLNCKVFSTERKKVKGKQIPRVQSIY